METWPLVSVFHYKDVINPTPDYQRYAVWSRQQQQLLIDSILKGLDIPKLYLRETVSGSPFKFEAVDGQQRLRAVWEFFENKYGLNEDFTPEWRGKRYQDLPMEVRQQIDHYQFSLVIIRDSTDEEIREMFCRLQNGKPLNAAEKRNAMVSNMRDFCADLAGHDFFNSVRFGNSRMQYQQVAAQTVLLELAGGPATCRNSSLERMYKDQESFDSNGKVAKKVKKVYDFLLKCFPERAPELKRGLVVSLYLLISDLMKGYSVNGREAALQKFLMEFDYKRRTADDDNDMVRYNEKMSHASDGEESIRFRHEILLREIHEFIPDLIPLDSQRGFDEHQRRVIYHRDGGKCKYCGTNVAWKEFHADHVVAHSKGGPTTVDNGWLSCQTCNTRKGKRTVEQVT